MNSGLDQLAERIAQLVSLVRHLREENRTLRLELAEAQTEERVMRERVDAARLRVEALIERLPADQ